MSTSKEKFVKWVSDQYGGEVASDCQTELAKETVISTSRGEAVLGVVFTRRQIAPQSRELPFTSSAIDGDYVPGPRIIK